MSIDILGTGNVNQCIDENGNIVLTLPATTSAVNYLQVTNAATGQPATVSALGSDANIGIRLVPKGTGGNLLNPQALVPVAMGTGVHTDVTATALQGANTILQLTGTPDAGVNLIVPNYGLYVIINTCGQAATVKTAAGTGIAVANAKNAVLVADGTNVRRVTADT